MRNPLWRIIRPSFELIFCTLSIVAVTGLAGHAYGSWKSRKTQKMWLQDFLPIEPDIRRVRIMTYGYNTKLIEDTIDDGMVDYRRHFIQQLTNSRDSPEVPAAL